MRTLPKGFHDVGSSKTSVVSILYSSITLSNGFSNLLFDVRYDSVLTYCHDNILFVFPMRIFDIYLESFNKQQVRSFRLNPFWLSGFVLRVKQLKMSKLNFNRCKYLLSLNDFVICLISSDNKSAFFICFVNQNT